MHRPGRWPSPCWLAASLPRPGRAQARQAGAAGVAAATTGSAAAGAGVAAATGWGAAGAGVAAATGSACGAAATVTALPPPRGPSGPAQRELVPPPARPQALPWPSSRAWRERARPSPGSTERLERGFRPARPPALQLQPEPWRRSGQGSRPEIFRPAWPRRRLACSRHRPPRHRGHGRSCLPSGSCCPQQADPRTDRTHGHACPRRRPGRRR